MTMEEIESSRLANEEQLAVSVASSTAAAAAVAEEEGQEGRQDSLESQSGSFLSHILPTHDRNNSNSKSKNGNISNNNSDDCDDIVGEKKNQNARDSCCHEEALEILLEGIDLVSNLAAMDSSDYITGKNISVNKEDIQARLDELQSKWALEETKLPSLVASIHRLQSNIGHLQHESTTFTSQLNEIQLNFSKTKNQNVKLRKAFKKMYSMNQNLVGKLRKKKEESRQFIKTVKEFVSQKRQEELDAEELIVACHESMMKNKIKENQRNQKLIKSMTTGSSSSLNKVGVNRSRTNTAESTFSDLDAYSCFGDYSIFEEESPEQLEEEGEDDSSYNFVLNASSRSKVRNVDVGRLEVGDYTNSLKSDVLDKSSNFIEQGCHDISFDSSASAVSASSCRSFVTEEIDPTLKLSDVVNIPVVQDMDHEKDSLHFFDRTNPSFKSIGTTHPYSISFPSSRPIGLQFIEVPTSRECDSSSGSLHWESENRKRSFSDGATLELSVVNEHEEEKAVGHKSGWVPLTTMYKARKAGSSGTDLFHSKSFPHHRHTMKRSSFAVVENILGLHGPRLKDHSHQDRGSSYKSTAILVQDFDGFDTSLHVRPTIGARLVAINNQSLLEGQWTLAKVQHVLEDLTTDHDETENVTNEIILTFRNDSISKIQSKFLARENPNPTCIDEREIGIKEEDATQCAPKIAKEQSSKKTESSDDVIGPVHTRTSNNSNKEKNPFSFFSFDGLSTKKDDKALTFFGITITKQTDNPK